jgi:hypothetical protein
LDGGGIWIRRFVAMILLKDLLKDIAEQDSEK